MVSEDFLMSLWEKTTPPGVAAANLNPRGMVGRINVVNHYALLQTKYRRCRFLSFREDFFKVILYYRVSLSKLMKPGCGQFGPQEQWGMVGMIYVGDHRTLLYAKSILCASW